MKYLLILLTVTSAMYAASAQAELTCFRTSDCDSGSYCRPVADSAMGLCTERSNQAAVERSKDTEQFNPWVTGGGLEGYKAEQDGDQDE